MKKTMIATAAIWIAAVMVLAQESPLSKAIHVYTNTTPLESVTYDAGSAVTTKIADIKYAVKLEELSNEGVWVDIGPARYDDPQYLYTTNQVLMSVSTNDVSVEYVTSSILGIDTTATPNVTNMQYIVSSSNAVQIVSNYTTRVYLNIEIPDMVTYDRLNSAFMSVSLTNYFPTDITNIWTFENGLLKTHSVLP
jgi:hypothetical protein